MSPDAERRTSLRLAIGLRQLTGTVIPERTARARARTTRSPNIRHTPSCFLRHAALPVAGDRILHNSAIPATAARPSVEPGGDAVVDVLGTVVGVNPLNHKGKRLDEPFEHRQPEPPGDGLDATHELEPGHVIDEVDVADPPGAIPLSDLPSPPVIQSHRRPAHELADGLPVGPRESLCSRKRGRGATASLPSTKARTCQSLPPQKAGSGPVRPVASRASSDDPGPRATGSLLVGFTPPLQAHVSLDKTACCSPGLLGR